jgi:AhpD family alkylhydroperoxidase
MHIYKEVFMSARLNHTKISPDHFNKLMALTQGLKDGVIAANLRDLIFTRISQINGCAFCLDMHTREAREGGETEQRLYTLNAWAETPFYNDKERAALAYAEAITLISESDIFDELYAELKANFNDTEISELTYLIATMNFWNRLGIAFKLQPALRNTAAAA